MFMTNRFESHNSCNTSATQADFFSCNNVYSILVKGTIIIVSFLLVVIILSNLII